MADRLVATAASAQFKQRRAFRRYCGAVALGSQRPLSEIAFKEGEKGHAHLPDAPELWFSFSSCRWGFIGGWSPASGIGIDLEDRTRTLDAAGLAQQLFPEAEAKVVSRAAGRDRQRTFFQLWTLKEAALKSIGEGLILGLDVFEFELTPTPRVVRAPGGHGGPERFDAYLIEQGDCCAALVLWTKPKLRRGDGRGRAEPNFGFHSLAD